MRSARWRDGCKLASLGTFGLFAILASGIGNAGVVGTGTPASCTQAALSTQIAAGGTVTFDCGGPATIAINFSLAISASNPTTTIDGAGVITLDGAAMPAPQNSMIMVFGSVASVPNITFRNIRLTNGNAATGLNSGGAILNSGVLTLDTVTLDHNHAAFGGAVGQEKCTGCPAASLTVVNSTFANNTASTGGAIDLFGNSTFTTSGTITQSTFVGNSAVFSGGAVNASNLQGGSVTIANSTFNGNLATGASPGG